MAAILKASLIIEGPYNSELVGAPQFSIPITRSEFKSDFMTLKVARQESGYSSGQYISDLVKGTDDNPTHQVGGVKVQGARVQWYVHRPSLVYYKANQARLASRRVIGHCSEDEFVVISAAIEALKQDGKITDSVSFDLASNERAKSTTSEPKTVMSLFEETE